MISVEYDSLCIEVTRRCNMHCAHCLRGDACNVDISSDYIERLLESANYINNITFTGGEPSLNVKAIEDTLRICKEKSIPVNSFYVVTNGKKVTNRFIKALTEWAMYCLETDDEALEYCGVCVSKDKFHEKIDPINIQKLKTLSFFNEDKTIDFSVVPLLSMGRAKDIKDPGVKCREADRSPISIGRFDSHGIDGEDENLHIESTVTLTSTGNFIPDCDYAYEEESDLSIGSVTTDEDLKNLLQYLLEQTEN